jgi:hypothetical protein
MKKKIERLRNVPAGDVAEKRMKKKLMTMSSAGDVAGKRRCHVEARNISLHRLNIFTLSYPIVYYSL